MDDMDERYISCACFGEALHLVRYEDEGSVSLSLSVYEPRGSRPSWRWRLKYIWRILTKGHPYEDEVILTQPQVHELVTWLQEFDDTNEGV